MDAVTLRHTARTMTGTPSRGAEVVVGYDADGRPRVTVYPYGREHACYDEARVLREMVADLQAAIAHLGEAAGA